VTPRREGTPQGSPLSPLLSNIILNELDQNLQERGHRFVRYADDCSIYVRSRKSAHRVMENASRFLGEGLKLKVNREKSKVSRPTASTLLGFWFYGSKEGWQVRIAPGSLESIKRKMREHTKRNDPINTNGRITKLERIIRGWVNYFSIAKAKSHLLRLDEMIRVSLRMIVWKQWKKIHTRMRNLIKLSIPKGKAYEWSNSRKSYCRIAHSSVLSRALNNAYFTKLKYTGFANYYYWKTEHQKKLF